MHINNLCAQTIKKCYTCRIHTHTDTQISIILAWKSVLWPVNGTRWSESASCLPACRSDLWACIFPSVRLMSDYHSCCCPSFYCEDKCVTHIVITPPHLLFLLNFFLFPRHVLYCISPPKIYPLPPDPLCQWEHRLSGESCVRGCKIPSSVWLGLC